MDIRIRKADQSANWFLHTADSWAEVESVMASVRLHGANDGDNVEHKIVGQYVITEDGAYFEIVVGAG